MGRLAGIGSGIGSDWLALKAIASHWMPLEPGPLKADVCADGIGRLLHPRACHCANKNPELLSISGLVAEYIVAIDVTRVRFPADALICYTSFACFWWGERHEDERPIARIANLKSRMNAREQL